MGDKFVVIADRVEGLSQHSVQRYFHLDFTDVKEAAGGVVATSDIANLVIFTSEQGQLEFCREDYRTRMMLHGLLLELNFRAVITARRPFDRTCSL